jgi:hypothetical protein
MQPLAVRAWFLACDNPRRASEVAVVVVWSGGEQDDEAEDDYGHSGQ